jgi:hypothetical protein
VRHLYSEERETWTRDADNAGHSTYFPRDRAPAPRERRPARSGVPKPFARRGGNDGQGAKNLYASQRCFFIQEIPNIIRAPEWSMKTPHDTAREAMISRLSSRRQDI